MIKRRAKENTSYISFSTRNLSLIPRLHVAPNPTKNAMQEMSEMYSYFLPQLHFRAWQLHFLHILHCNFSRTPRTTLLHSLNTPFAIARSQRRDDFAKTDGDRLGLRRIRCFCDSGQRSRTIHSVRLSVWEFCGSFSQYSVFESFEDNAAWE